MTMDILQAGATKLGLRLSSVHLEQFELYYRELIDWNQRVNLTSVTDYTEVQTRHFLDSLTVIQTMDQPPDDSRVMDVGAGAGLPGLPLKIVFPGMRLVLLEATGKKTAFLSHLVDRLGLNDVEVVTGRAEEVAHQPEYREGFDVVLSKGVASLAALVELTLPFCAIGGVLSAHKKGDIYKELARAERAITTLGGQLREVHKVELEDLSGDFQLVVIDKISATPQKYPRRSGIPAKRPLV